MFNSTLKNRLAAAAVIAASALGLTAKTEAAAVLYGANAATTNSTLFATGDRRLDTMGFLGSSTQFTAANFLNFDNGSLTTFVNGQGVKTFGWNQQVPRDVTVTGYTVSANPDRSVTSTPYAGEAGKTGTMAEVFGPFTHDAAVTPYKNMSYLVDGSVLAAGLHSDMIFTLLFPKGMVLNADSDNNTIELAWLERGGNSDVNVQGILGFDASNNPILTAPLKLSHLDGRATGWTLHSFESTGPATQTVNGIGVSLDSSWKNLLGFEFSNSPGFNIADTVAVGTSFLTPSTATPVPLPAAFPAGLTLLGIIAVARRFS